MAVHDTETHAVAEILGSSCNRYPFTVPQLVQPALDTKIRFPVLTIG